MDVSTRGYTDEPIYDGPPIRYQTNSPSNSSAWRYDRSGSTPPPTIGGGHFTTGGGYYQKRSPVSTAGSSSMSDSSEDEMRLAAEMAALRASATKSVHRMVPPQMNVPVVNTNTRGDVLRSPVGFPRSSEVSSTEKRRLSPGSLALSPVDTGLANNQSRDRVAAAVLAHSPSPRPPRPPPGRSPLSSDGVLSSGVSPASSLGGSPHQRSPTARLAFALSPMGDPTEGLALIEERKKARAARRAAQKALKEKQSKQQSTRNKK